MPLIPDISLCKDKSSIFTFGLPWVDKFTRGYYETHRDCGMLYVTPEKRHRGEDVSFLKQRDVPSGAENIL
ncbi:hypothetical protein [Tatumella citrea]|uniref:hypothetical protein n=1 Tax=Tatumella citrea TaxID=53336 RepID=UPI0012FA3BD7|nr:hypothetical protein [Tatumella citrea]